jgi:type II secretory pathway predicted ATPase ExeA
MMTKEETTMFEEFFEMKRTPFLNTITTDALYLSEKHKEILGRLEYAARGNLFAVLTAGVGVGKSTLVRKFSQTLDPEKYTVLYLADSKLTPRWFYKGLLDQLGIEAKFYRGDAKRQLHRQLGVIRDVHHRNVVVIVDEAHLLDRETLEEIRFVLNTDMDSLNPMGLVLVGQSELWDKLRMQLYAAIRGRIDIKCVLEGMDRAEIEGYMCAHLSYAGGKDEIFTDAALDEILRYSAGSARAVNKAATHCLMHSAQRGKKLIDDQMVKMVIEAELP